MILMRANPFPGPLEGVDPENLNFLGSLKQQRASPIWAQKVEILKAHLFQWPEYVFSSIKIMPHN